MLLTSESDRLATIMDLVLLRYGLIALVVVGAIALLALVIALLRRAGRADRAARLTEVVVREATRRLDADRER
ncbi:MAG TPA: hypothetical protein VFG92_09115 [Agromyces sp.]|nr:hypothetical protein [Agromyces sp.]